MPLTRSSTVANKNGHAKSEELKTETKKTKTKPAKREIDEKETEVPPKKTSKITKKQTEKEIPEDKSEKSDDTWKNAKNIYDFKAKDIKGNEVSLEKYKGHVCIVVNVASRCGHTKSNYEQFVEIFNKYSDEKGLRILSFPCNQFGKQEPANNATICEFAEKRNVKFDMFEKVDVNGKNAHPLWKYLTSQVAGPKGDKIAWNFTKFIIDKKGNVVERHASSVKPLSLVNNLEKYW